MIPNNWKKMLDKAGMKQSDLAERTGINKGVMSMVVQGERILPMEKLEDCLTVLDCSMGDVYSAKVQRAIYGVKPAAKTISVALDKNAADAVDAFLRENIGLYRSRKELVNALLRRALRSYIDADA